MKSNELRERILNESSYWVEGVNSFLYDAIELYMEKNSMKTQTELAKYLGISKGRVSQILNDGAINFSLEKIIDIALKVDKFPKFEFIDKSIFLQNERKSLVEKGLNLEKEKDVVLKIKRGKVIPMKKAESELHNLSLEMNSFKAQYVG